MPNAYPNKIQVVRGGQTETLIDLTADTAVASDVAQGKYFHLASGERVVGTATGGGGGAVYQDQDGYIVLSDQGGGSSSDTWSWMGRNPVKLQEFSEHLTFRELGIDQWTWSTSSTTIRDNSQSAGLEALTIDFADYDLVFYFRAFSSLDYGEWSPVSAMIRYAYCVDMGMCAFYGTASAVETVTPSGATGGNGANDYRGLYANSEGTPFIGQTAYSVYTYSSPTYENTVLGGQPVTVRRIALKKPQINARGHASYFSQDAYDHLDFDKSYYESLTEVWRVDAGTSNRWQVFGEIPNVLNNGLGVSS